MDSLPADIIGTRKFYLYPGEIFSNKMPHIVDTILGSCIAIFLWDPKLQFATINHYMLPSCYKPGEQSFKYGDVAIPEIISRMLQMGSNKTNLKAKIFGGSDLAQGQQAFNIGERNIDLAWKLMNNEHIPVISYSTGGPVGRKVIFYTSTGEVFITYLKQVINTINGGNNEPGRKR